MKCSDCVEEGKRSKIYIGGSSSTLLGWLSHYDEDGNRHDHDPNSYSTDYRCSNGHTWTKTTRHICRCGFPGSVNPMVKDNEITD